MRRFILYASLSLLAVAGGRQYASAQYSFRLDTSGKVKAVTKLSDKPGYFVISIDSFRLDTPAVLAGAEERAGRLLGMLGWEEHTERVEGAIRRFRKGRDTCYIPDSTFLIIDPGTRKVLHKIPQKGFEHPFSLSKHAALWLAKRSTVNAMIRAFYRYNPPTKPTNRWHKMYALQKQLYAIRDMICQLKSLNDKTDQALASALKAQIDFRYNSLKNDLLEVPAGIETEMIPWILQWLGFFDNRPTILPLGIVDKNSLEILKDTAMLVNSLKDVETVMHKTGFSTAYYYQELRKKQLELRLKVMRDYAEQAALSEKRQAAFTEYTVLSQLNLPEGCTYQRFHDAAGNLKLFNEKEVDGDTDIENDDKVCFTVVNIPFDKEAEIQKTSTGFVQTTQADRLISPFVEMFTKSGVADTLIAGEGRQLTTDEILHNIDFHLGEMAPYLASLPPATELNYAKEPARAGFKMKPDAIGPHPNDSAMNNTYTITIPAAGKEDPPLKGTFKYKSYRKSRVQFTAGAHFFAGDAPVVKREGNTNNFKLTSDEALRYSAGVKFYFHKQTFSDIKTWEKFRKKLGRSVHFMAAVDLNKPLDNFYFGPGIDIIPGLGLNAGAHLYSYTKYTIFNGELVGEQKSYRFRRGCYIAVTLDGSVLNKVFASFLKIK